jgi:hypothetical protein
MEKRPAWKQPQALVLIAGGGIIALGTLYLMVSTWGAPAPTAAAAPTARMLTDENALVAANAEPKGGVPAEEPAINASAAFPPPPIVQDSASKSEPERFNPNEISREAQRIMEEAQQRADQVEEEVEGEFQDDLDKPEPDGPK